MKQVVVHPRQRVAGEMAVDMLEVCGEDAELLEDQFVPSDSVFIIDPGQLEFLDDFMP